MWNRLWQSLGKATGGVVTAVAVDPAPAGSMARPPPRPADGGGIVAGMGLVAGRVCGTVSAQGRRACSGVRGLLAGLLQMAAGEGDCPPIATVDRQAASIAQILRERGVVPDRFGVDGLPGSGKSTLARALASKLDLRWVSLDFKDLTASGNIAGRRIIVEHHRLLRTQDVDVFDAIIFVNESPQRAMAKAVRRARGTMVAILLDFHRLKKIGDLAFDVCEAEPIAIPDSDLILKIRPPGGFRAMENIKRRLREAGLDAAGRSKEQMLFLLAFGEPQEGLAAYCLPYTCFVGLGGLAGWLRRAIPYPSVRPSAGESA